MALTCQAAVTRHAEEPGLEPCSEQAGRSREQADTCGIALNEQIPQDRETGTNSPGQTSGTFG